MIDILNPFYTNDWLRLLLVFVAGLIVWKFVLTYNPRLKNSKVDKKRK